jgi:hypothetical protein
MICDCMTGGPCSLSYIETYYERPRGSPEGGGEAPCLCGSANRTHATDICAHRGTAANLLIHEHLDGDTKSRGL